MITNNGDMSIEECNDMNIPVNSFIGPKEDGKWEWSADNFMPRKGWCTEDAYSLEADTKEEIMELIHKHIVPLYEAALNNLKTVGANYYWEPKE
jgi:hypothetical protein